MNDIKHLTLIKPLAMTPDLYNIFVGWLQRRGMAAEALDNIPHKGRIIYYNARPIAIGFIRDVEGGFAMIDGYLADPDSDVNIRSKCLDLLTLDLFEYAKSLKLNKIFAFTVNKKTIKRALKLGFNKQKHTLILRSI
jgi:hypothetical protein